MAFTPDKIPPQFADLKSILAQSKVLDNALHQMLQILIDRLDELEGARVEVINNINNSVNTITSIVNFLTNNTATYITSAPEEVALPNSRQLLPGTGISFDDTVPNRRTINGVPAGNDYDLDYLGNYTPVTYNNGDIVVGADGITYVCVKDGVTAPPVPWAGSSPGSVIHHASHETGGGDVVTVTKLGGYPGGTANFLRADGTFAAPPTGGIPSAHHVTHEPGGSDAIAGAAWLALPNVFTATKQSIAAINAQLVLNDTSQAVDAKIFRIMNSLSYLYFHSLNDAQTAVVATPLTLSRTGDVYAGRDIFEKGRSTQLGHWINYPITIANVGVAAGTVSAFTAYFSHYTLIGKTLTWSAGFSANFSGTTLIYLVPPIIGVLNADGSAKVGTFTDAGGNDLNGNILISTGWGGGYPVIQRYAGGVISGTVTCMFTITYQIN